jgi:hypothetical protein
MQGLAGLVAAHGAAVPFPSAFAPMFGASAILLSKGRAAAWR